LRAPLSPRAVKEDTGVLYLLLNEGPTPESATPIIATSDPVIIRAVADAFVKKLGGRTPAPVRRLGTPWLQPVPTPVAPPAPDDPAAS
jgi:hypothetical protein